VSDNAKEKGDSMLDLNTATIKPGDLITSQFMTDLIATLKDMESRIEGLETAQPDPAKLVITGLSTTGPIRINDELQVYGKNFGYGQGNLAVVFSDGAATYSIAGFKPGSGSEKLIFSIPPIPSVPQSGKIVTMTVSNTNGSDSRMIAVIPPPQVLIGNVDVELLSVSPGTVSAGSPATFKYRITSRANLKASFTISPVISVSQWQNMLLVLDGSMTSIPNAAIQLNPGQVQEVNIQIPSVPSSPSVSSFTLLVSAKGDVNGSDGPRTFVLGSPVAQPDDTISINFDYADPPEGYDSATGKVSLAQGSSLTLSLWAIFKQADTYLLTTLNTGTKWDIALSDPSSPFTMASTDLNQPDGTGKKNVIIVITALSGASASGTGEFAIQHQGQTKRASIPFGLSLM